MTKPHDELLACPFCGSDDVQPDGAAIHCAACGANAEDRAAWNTRPAHPQAGEVVASEAGWLIERADERGPLYRQASGSTRDASAALRFCRKTDADAFIAANEGGQYVSVAAPKWHAVEHRWG